MKKIIYLFLIIGTYLGSSLTSANERIENHKTPEHLLSEEHRSEHEHEDDDHEGEHEDGEHEDDDHEGEHEDDDHEGEHEDDEHEEGEHGDDDGHGEHGDEEEGVTSIKAEIAEQVGIQAEYVSSQTLKQRISTYGQLKASPEQLSHVRARFPGLISSVNVGIGDDVKKGAELAKIESNDSLRTYTIHSPIEGTVIQRHANTGEFTSDQVLFSIANFETLWAELRIYPSQRSLVKVGQNIVVKSNDLIVESKISHLIPVIDQPYQLARIELNNSKLNLSPGDFVEGYVVVAEFKALIAIANDAIQTMEGKDGVFIKDGESYRFNAIKKGRSDDAFTEVLSGVDVGDEYVTKNSYLLKADIEKSEAEHEH